MMLVCNTLKAKLAWYNESEASIIILSQQQQQQQTQEKQKVNLCLPHSSALVRNGVHWMQSPQASAVICIVAESIRFIVLHLSRPTQNEIKDFFHLRERFGNEFSPDSFVHYNTNESWQMAFWASAALNREKERESESQQIVDCVVGQSWDSEICVLYGVGLREPNQITTAKSCCDVLFRREIIKFQ